MESHSRKIKRMEEMVESLANELEKLKNDTHG